MSLQLSKTSLDFGFFFNVNQNMKAWRLLSRPFRKQKSTSTGSKVIVCDLWLVGFDSFCVSVFQGSLLLNFRVHMFSFFSSQVVLPAYWNMASLDSQAEIFSIQLPSPEDHIWEGENESVHSRQNLNFQLLFVYNTTFIWQARIGCYGNSLIDVKEKPKILKCWVRCVNCNSCKWLLLTPVTYLKQKSAGWT